MNAVEELIIRNPEIVSFVERIRGEGGRVYSVGGYVRDGLLGVRSKDIDFEVYGIPPRRLAAICRKCGYVKKVGMAFAVLKLTFRSGMSIDISVPRRETPTGVGHRDFDVSADPFMSVEEAASRRDLTINAILSDPLTGEIIDPFGGVADLRAGLLRHISERFSEDPLRVVRVVRFAALLNFDVVPATIRFCRRMVRSGSLSALPRERIEEEFRKIFCKGRNLYRAFRYAVVMDIIRLLLPELHALRGVRQDPRYHAEGDALTHTFLALQRASEIARRDGLSETETYILCLSALTHDLGKAVTTRELPDGRIISHGHAAAGIPGVRRLLDRITGQVRIKEHVLALVNAHMRPLQLAQAANVSDGAIRRLARDIQPSNLSMLTRLTEADASATRHVSETGKINPHLFLRKRAEELGVERTPPRRILLGRDLIRLAKAGRLPERFRRGGPHFGVVLDAVYEAQIEGTVSSREEAEALAIQIISEGR